VKVCTDVNQKCAVVRSVYVIIPLRLCGLSALRDPPRGNHVELGTGP